MAYVRCAGVCAAAAVMHSQACCGRVIPGASVYGQHTFISEGKTCLPVAQGDQKLLCPLLDVIVCPGRQTIKLEEIQLVCPYDVSLLV